MEFATKLFTPQFFAANRQKLQAAFGGTAPIVISANGRLVRSRDDDAYDFHQDSSFWYLTGVNEPNFVLVIDKTKSYLIGPQLSESWKIFNGDINFEQLKQTSGVDEVLSGTVGWQKLAKRLKKAKHVATLMPPKVFSENYQVYSNPASRRLLRQLKSHNSELQLIDISTHIFDLRMVKQEPEIKAIKQAIDETAQIYKIIGKKLSKYKTEREISAEIDYLLAQKGLKYAFRQIVAGGQNAVTLHYNKNNSILNPDELLLIDMGAAYNGYAADLTRTICANPNKRQLEVYDAVKKVQEFAIKMLRPGLQLESYEAAIGHYMGEKLRELGLIKTIDNESVRRYYPHSTSHFLGLDVHDVGDYSKPLTTGVVLTVEPGIYIAEENIGIRIEDNILITDEGCEILSSGLSRELGSLTIK